MKDTIKYGIDLGTTNSAICKFDNGLKLIKCDQMDTMPSCVQYPKIRCGINAYNQLKSDRARSFSRNDDISSVFTEFKRNMGTDVLHYYEGGSVTPEELSAEVLKKLRSYSQEDFEAAVITIPAVFRVPQQQATEKAARLAGFKQVRLLQEPVAAALAYGYTESQDSGKWLVFDFGGGTFDSAIVVNDNGKITVSDTEGDIFLGGRDMDFAIVRELIIPEITKDSKLLYFLNDSKFKQRLEYALLKYAEQAKKALSFDEFYELESEVGELILPDGSDLSFYFTLSRQQLKDVIEPICMRAIQISIDLLSRNNLSGSDLDKVILVGGPTLSPIFRELIAQHIKAPDTSQDPMTAVAMGSAFYASGIKLDDELIQNQLDQANRIEKVIGLNVTYDPKTVSNESFVTVKLKNYDEQEYFVELKSINFRSHTEKISKDGAFFELKLESSKLNVFEINLKDHEGKKYKCFPDQITINQGIEEAGSPLTNYLGMEILKDGKGVFENLRGAEKNAPLPVTGISEGRRTPLEIRPGVKSDVMRISIYEGGADARGSKVVYCDHVADYELNGDMIQYKIPANSVFDLTIKTQRSSAIPETVLIYFPVLDIECELDTSLQATKRLDNSFIIRELKNLRVELSNLIEKNRINPKQIEDIEVLIRDVSDKIDKGVEDRGNFDQVCSRIKECARKLDHIAESSSWRILTIEADNEISSFENVLKEKKIQNQTEILESIYARFSSLKNRTGTDQDKFELREFIEEVKERRIELIRYEGLVYWVYKLSSDFDRTCWVDKSAAKDAINRSKQLIDDDASINELMQSCRDIYELLCDKEKGDENPGPPIPR